MTARRSAPPVESHADATDGPYGSDPVQQPVEVCMHLRRPITLLAAIALMATITGTAPETASATTVPPRQPFDGAGTAGTLAAMQWQREVQPHVQAAERSSVQPAAKKVTKKPQRFRKKILPIRRAAGISRPSHLKPIRYHGGPVMTGPTHLYLIWYGMWDGNSATSILTDFANSIGGSPYYAINASYMQMDFGTVGPDVTVAGQIADAYSQGKRLTDTDVRQVVGAALRAGTLPIDESGIYTVLTSADVVETSGFTTSYCGWHSHARMQKSDIKFAFIGDPTTQGLTHCSAQTVGPNDNPGADAMVSVFAHEIVETVTDPDANGWYDSNGNENADKCAWTYGKTHQVNGAKVNISLGTRDYLIQQNWNTGKQQGCSMKPLN